jgi:hypothetical protein
MAQYLAVLELSDLDGDNGFAFYGELAGDRSGWAVVSAGDINNDGFDDLIIGAPKADPNGSDSGMSYVVFGDKNFAASMEVSDLVGATTGIQIVGELEGDQSGWAVASAGDVNDDGFDDFIIGANRADPNDTNSGASYVVFGKGSVFDDKIHLSDLDGDNGFQINGAKENSFSGHSVSSAGDVNGDGFADVIIGARNAYTDGGYTGAAYVVFGKDGGFDAEVELGDLDGDDGFQIAGKNDGDAAGFSVGAAGDVNGDGLADLIVGANGTDPNGLSSGASFVVFGSTSGFDATMSVADIDGANGFQISGETAGDFSGVSVSSAGDVNGDGIGDLIVGADRHGANDEGAAFVVFGKSSGFASTLQLSSLDGNNGFEIPGEAGGDCAGISVSSAGDFNGDGFDDVIVGAWLATPPGFDPGVSYVVFGKASGFAATLDLSDLDGNNGFQINGEAADDRSGHSVAGAGDVNGDGFDDLIVGSYGADPNGGESGTSYVIFGGMPGEAVTRVGTDIGNTIRGGNFNDTLTGLGGLDRLVGYDGKDVLKGGADRDVLQGGGGKDKLTGGAGGDSLDGGKKADTFIYADASHSSSTAFDSMIRFDFSEDRFDLPDAVTGIDPASAGGTLNVATFDSDLAAGVAGLAAGHAMIFAPDAGDFAGMFFLVVDANGTSGYQAGDDFVMRLAVPKHLGDFGIEDFI